MALMDIFKGFRAGDGKTMEQQQAAAAQPAPVATVPGQTPTTPVTPVAATPNGIPAPAVGEASPLDGYAKMWETADTDAKPIAPAFQFEIKPDAILASARQVDYTKVVPPELLAKAQAGDGAALIEVINRTNQQTAANASHTTAALVNEALTQQSKHYETNVIPGILRRNNIVNAVREDNPLTTNPAAAPMVAMVTNQLTQKYPSAPPEEIKRMTNEYLNEFAGLAITSSGKQIVDAPKVDPKAAAPMDWVNWATGTTGSA
jgi:hypothetical protein